MIWWQFVLIVVSLVIAWRLGVNHERLSQGKPESRS
jgi:hypothetical protein